MLRGVTGSPRAKAASTYATGRLAPPFAGSGPRPRLVLCGAGHAHLFVLEAIIRGELPPCDLVVCTAEARHVYSGMVPGWLAGRYDETALSLDVPSLVRRAGGTLRATSVVALDPSVRRISLSDGSTQDYDLVPIAVGSEPSGLNGAGAPAGTVPLKPLGNVRRILERLTEISMQPAGDIVVVGGGVAGVEIAFGVVARLRQLGARKRVRVSLLSRDAALVPDRGPGVSRRVHRACARLGIQLGMQATVISAEERRLVVQGDSVRSSIATDLVIWATGPAAAPWLAHTGLPTDARGFLLVDEQLRTMGDRRVFAAGDAATLDRARWTSKAGVYAVRMGPRLVDALRHTLPGGAGRSPTPYVPQRRWLSLINTGDGRAIASWGVLAVEGRWAMELKDRIDRRFMRRFAQLVR